MYDEMCLDTFLAQQEKLFREPVAESREEAEEFLSDCFATVCENLKEVRAYFKEEGADIAGMSSEDLAERQKCSTAGRKIPDRGSLSRLLWRTQEDNITEG